jgi:light-regulated signal transduction histidine kinase (bacteriophytochrome)/HAMP domain-containing protein
VTFLALAAAWILVDVFIMRQTRGLIATTDKLASGDLTARTNLSYEAGEVGQLARAFDRMADSLAERNRERDRAERSMQEYAAELERSNRDLQDFANIASHDMQEPLRKIQVFSDLMQMRYGEDLDERGVEYLERMQSAAHRMQELINDLLAYSRISTRAKPFEPVDLNHIIQEVLTDFDLQIEKGGAVVKAEELPKIEADPIQMHQLFQNLISNALKFHKTGQAPVVKISGEKITGLEAGKDGGQHEARRYQIRVSDEGIGFEEKYRERIFLPFQRLYGPGDYEGSGMGLAICRKIVQRHGGVITVSSKPGEGTTFYIDLPINQDGERKMP